MWTRAVSQKALSQRKKLDDLDEALEEIQGASPMPSSESDSSPTTKNKANARKKSNAVERKKNKKTDEVDQAAPETLQEAPRKAAPEVPQELPQEEASPEVSSPQSEVPQEAVLEEAAEEVVTEKVAKMLAKKQERKEKKAQEKKLSEEKAVEVVEEKEEPEFEPEILAVPEVKTDAEAHSAPVAVEESHEEEVHEEEEVPVEQIANVMLMSTHIDTDSESDDDVCVPSGVPEGISTPELTPRGHTGSTWLMDTSMPHMPVVPRIEGMGMPEGMVQVPEAMAQGWMAVAVPAEYAPAGAPGPFDGLWKNGDNERIVIDHEEILFESGMKWMMTMQSITNLSVNVGGEEFNAELDISGQTLRWSDGDVWACCGQTDAQQRWASQREAQGLSCFVCSDEQPQFFPMDPMCMAMEPMAMNMPMVMEAPSVDFAPSMPQDAKSWEVCWDWTKKGYCKKGASCDWYHPGEQQQQQAPQWQNRKSSAASASAPFSEFMDAPYAGF